MGGRALKLYQMPLLATYTFAGERNRFQRYPIYPLYREVADLASKLYLLVSYL